MSEYLKFFEKNVVSSWTVHSEKPVFGYNVENRCFVNSESACSEKKKSPEKKIIFAAMAKTKGKSSTL